MTPPKTEKSYLDEPYVSRFQAAIVSTAPVPDGDGVDIVLDRTYFYPESGGQLSDRGSLGGADVIDVIDGPDEVVVHRLAAAPSGGTGEVTGEVDWKRRFDHMQQHTGQHLLSRAFIETGDLHTVSFHMGDDSCTIDVEGGTWSDAAVVEAERLANTIIEENRPVNVTVVAASELDDDAMRRKLPEGVTDARIVEIADFDTIPCCGTHVRSTGELRLVKVLKSEKVKRGRRVYFKVGRRALDDYAEKHALLTDLSTRMTTSHTDVGDRVNKLIEENQSARKRLKSMGARLAVLEAARLCEAARENGAVRSVACVVEDADGDFLRALSREVTAREGMLALLASADGTLVLAASDGVGADFAAAGEIVRAAGGNGGGKGGFAQYRVPAGADINQLITKVEAHVLNNLA